MGYDISHHTTIPPYQKAGALVSGLPATPRAAQRVNTKPSPDCHRVSMEVASGLASS